MCFYEQIQQMAPVLPITSSLEMFVVYAGGIGGRDSDEIVGIWAMADSIGDLAAVWWLL